MNYVLCLSRQNRNAILQQTPEPKGKEKQPQSINSSFIGSQLNSAK